MRFLLALALLVSVTVTPALAAQETIAKAAYILDVQTGAVLLSKDADLRMPTASMSKVMTALVVYDALRKGQIRLTDTFTVSQRAWEMQGSKMFVELGSQIPVEDLIKGVIIQSGNDATVVLAEGIAGSVERFAGLMNEKAAEYGMKGSHFMNSSGWPDPEHYSTPHDLAIMAYHMVTDYPDFYKYDSMREFTWHGITQQNRNPLLGAVAGADGMKTGHTEEAGYGLIGSAKRNDRRVIMVLSGLQSDKDRASESIRLMNWALDSFRNLKVISAGQVVGRAPIVYGTSDSVALIAGKDVVATVPATFTAQDMKVKIKYKSPLIAPVKEGQVVGTVTVDLPGAGTQEYPMLAALNIPQKGWFGMTLDKILQAAKN